MPPRALSAHGRSFEPYARTVTLIASMQTAICFAVHGGTSYPNPAPRCSPQDAHAAADDSFLSPGRRLSTTCTFKPTQVDDFTSEVGNVTGACGIIELESGVYNLTQTLNIARDLTIRAQTEAPGSAVGTVVLDGQNSVRVFRINSGRVALIGLDITNGKSSEVCRAVGNALASARNPGRLAR